MGRGKPISQDVREIIISSSKSGKSVHKIAQDLHLPRFTIHSIIQHYKKTGRISSLKKTGRPRITTPAENRF